MKVTRILWLGLSLTLLMGCGNDPSPLPIEGNFTSQQFAQISAPFVGFSYSEAAAYTVKFDSCVKECDMVFPSEEDTEKKLKEECSLKCQSSVDAYFEKVPKIGQIKCNKRTCVDFPRDILTRWPIRDVTWPPVIKIIDANGQTVLSYDVKTEKKFYAGKQNGIDWVIVEPSFAKGMGNFAGPGVLTIDFPTGSTQKDVELNINISNP